MNNMNIWDQVKQPPPSALRTIQAGRLKGKTDINPQWRYQVMTEQFGVAGLGWSYTIEKLWAEPCNDGQVFAFAQINLWVKGSDKPIPGIGGSMLVTKEKEGLHASDEGYKMAVTDALSVAMKMLGVAADVYGGLWDGSKYRDDKPKVDTKVSDKMVKSLVEAAKEAGGVIHPEQQTLDSNAVTDKQRAAIFAIMRDMGITDEQEQHEHVSRILELPETITSMKSLTKAQGIAVIKELNNEKNL